MRTFVLLIAALALIGPARAQNADAAFRNGLSAFNEGTYARARAVWGPLADAGDARAQAGLGYMYYSGRGVERDSARAAELFHRAADQGEPTAQLFLGMMHFQSDGVPKNSALAMMWLELAMAGGLGEAYELRSMVMQSMTESEREEGWRLLARWRESHAKGDATK